MIAVDAPITEQAETIDRVWNLFLGLGLVVLLLVAGLMLWVILRYRRRTDDGPHHLPPQKHYNIPMEVTYVVIPLAIVLGLFAVTFVTVAAIDDDDRRSRTSSSTSSRSSGSGSSTTPTATSASPAGPASSPSWSCRRRPPCAST